MCYVLTFMFKLLGRKSACKTFAGSSEILRWLTPFLGPNMDPKWGPELDHIFIPSFRSLLGPRFGVQIWTQKWGQPSENFAAARRCLQADLRRTSMSVSVNTCFPLCASQFVSCTVTSNCSDTSLGTPPSSAAKLPMSNTCGLHMFKSQETKSDIKLFRHFVRNATIQCMQ